MLVFSPGVVATGFGAVFFGIVEEEVVEPLELAVPKGIVVDAVGVGTTERDGFSLGVKTEPRYTAALPIRLTTSGTKRVE